MTYKAYIDNIKAKTGKDPEYFLAATRKKGLTKHGELLAWLKTEMGPGTRARERDRVLYQGPEMGQGENQRGRQEGKSQKVTETQHARLATVTSNSNNREPCGNDVVRPGYSRR